MIDKSLSFTSLGDLANQLKSAAGGELAAMLDAFSAFDPSPVGPTPPLEVTDATILAAISETFLIEEIAAGDQQSQILANAETVVVGGRTRLKLSDAARGELLGRLQENDRYKVLLSNKVKQDQHAFAEIAGDPVLSASAWLRSFLDGDPGDIFRAPLCELRAAVSALEALRYAPPLKAAPRLDEAYRALELSELLEPLRILIGSEGGWGGEGDPPRDRFVGREPELRRLRRFVGELASQSMLESVVRSVDATRRRARGAVGTATAEVLMIEAQGGMGKSALMAKFVLDHVLAKDTALLFAYIDFDRATVQPRDPRMLLHEVLRQVCLQSDEPGFNDLRDAVRSLSGGGLQPERNFCQEFRNLVRGSKRHDTLLVVLDTLEVAQYDPLAIDGIDSFLDELIGDERFPDLRIVMAGRADMGDMRFLQRLSKTLRGHHKLPPLSIDDAAAMAGTLGGAMIGGDWDPLWAARIAGGKRSSLERREPLSIRVAVDTLVSKPAEEREALSLEIARMGEGADESFVGRLYQERVLKHVREEEVRRLAWPGLVLRNVTLALVEDVLAGPCYVPRERAAQAFEKLGKEIWMVETKLEDSVTILKHRRELRARTLPLMRRHDPELFQSINSAATAYFETRRSDIRHKAEWIYHRLLAGESPSAVDRDWEPDLAALLADAPDDFPNNGAGSEARLYLQARTAPNPLRRAVLSRLGDRLAWEHMARAGATFGEFAERQLIASVRDLSMRLETPTLSRAAEAARACLLIKAGRWEDADPPGEAAIEWSSNARFAAAYRAARQTSAQEARLESPDALAPCPDDYRSMCQEVAFFRVHGPKSSFEQTDELLAEVLEDLRFAPQDLDPAALRVAALFGQESCRPAARLWASVRQHALSVSQYSPISAAELRAFRDERPEAFEAGSLAGGRVLQHWLEIADRAKGPARFLDPELSLALQEALAQVILQPPANVLQLVRRLLAQRQDDWLYPLAYSAARALHLATDNMLVPLRTRALAYGAHARTDSGVMIQSELKRRDFLSVLRRADQASDLRGMVGAIEAVSPEGLWLALLQRRIADLDAWTSQIDVVSATPRTAPKQDTTPPRPGPVLNKADPQKGRWGGLPEREGRRLSAIFNADKGSIFDVDLIVESTDGSALIGPVLFHLHDSFARSNITIRKIQAERRAALQQVTAYGAFTAGAQVRDRNGRWVGLEYDLVGLAELPARFHDL